MDSPCFSPYAAHAQFQRCGKTKKNASTFPSAPFRATLKKATRDPVGLWTLVIIVAVIVLLVGILFIGEHGWRAAGLDIDGRQR